MRVELNRREFATSLALVPLAAKAAFAAQDVDPAFPIIDTHIHLFDKTRPEGAPYPRDVPGGGEPVQGMIALPNRYREITEPFGVVGAIVVEASPRLDDNQWVLDVAANAPNIVGLVGRIDPADQAFGRHLDRLRQNPLFLGIRQGQLHLGLDDADYIGHLKLLADADCSLDVDTPRQGMTAPEVLVRLLDKVPSLRLVMDHLPDVRFLDRATKDTYLTYLRELGQRPQVFIKLSEVVRSWGGQVSTRLYVYKDWLDELWDIFGEDRVMFGSDWPQSETLEFNSYPNVFRVAQAYARSKGPSAMEKVFWKNSLRPYRWVQRLPSQRQV
jgi:L-fuconolactonase